MIAVLHDRDPARVVQMRMRVLVGGRAVGGQPDVADAGRPARAADAPPTPLQTSAKVPDFFAAASPPSTSTATPAES